MDPLKLGFGEQVLALIIYSYLLFKLTSFYVALALLAGSFTAIYFYLKYRSEYWARLGIKGPEGNILFGHNLELTKGFDVTDTEWTKKYGKVFGTIIFAQPELVVSDFEILRHVLAKDFSCFTNRKKMLGLKTDFNSGRVTSNILGLLEDDHWKNVRNTITPAFTTGKMKNMVPIFNDCMKIFGEVVSQHTKLGQPVDLKKLCGNFALDVIAKSAFGMDIDAQKGDSSSPFIKYAYELFNATVADPKIVLLLLFPNIIRKLEKIFKFQYFFAEGDKFFKNVLHTMITERQKNPKKINPDFLQLLLNAMRDPEGETDVDREIAHEEIDTGKRVKLTEIEIMSQLLVFLLAGYETTATTLHFVLYMLAMHPEIQDKVAAEIHQVTDNTDEISYEHVGKLTYLDQVINETLRMFPPAARMDRDCSKDVVINGVIIPKGCAVSVPIWIIHYDPEIYPNPQKFDPERFSAEERANRDPLAFLPFGYGPRNCIGMRFAQLEMRMALAYLVKNFKFTPCELTQKMPVKVILQGITKPASPLYVTVEKRE